MRRTCPERIGLLARLELWKATDWCLTPCRSMKVLGSWCGDCGRSSGALLQAGNSAIYKHEGLLRDKTLPIAGRAKAFGCRLHSLGATWLASLDNAGLRKGKGWEGRWLRSMRHFRRGNWETHQHFMKRTEDALDTIYTKNEFKLVHISRTSVLPYQCSFFCVSLYFLH